MMRPTKYLPYWWTMEAGEPPHEGSGIVKTKDELLKYYAQQAPTDFLLVDVHQIGPGFDSEDPLTGMYPNEHGLCVMVGMSTQLSEAAGEGGLRILIGRKMSRKKIEQALRHVLEEVEFPEPRTADDDREMQEYKDEYEGERAPAPSVLRSMIDEAIHSFCKSGKVVKVLDSAGVPKLEDGKQLYKVFEYATAAERAFFRKEMGSDQKPDDPPELASLRLKAKQLWPSLRNHGADDNESSPGKK